MYNPLITEDITIGMIKWRVSEYLSPNMNPTPKYPINERNTPKEINIKALQKLSIYSNKIACQYNYYSFCVSDFIKRNMDYSTNQNFTDID